jgi:hypothetical protein
MIVSCLGLVSPSLPMGRTLRFCFQRSCRSGSCEASAQAHTNKSVGLESVSWAAMGCSSFGSIWPLSSMAGPYNDTTFFPCDDVDSSNNWAIPLDKITKTGLCCARLLIKLVSVIYFFFQKNAWLNPDRPHHFLLCVGDHELEIHHASLPSKQKQTMAGAWEREDL